MLFQKTTKISLRIAPTHRSRFTFPDGSSASFSFEADEGGYRVESDLLPTPPPLPAHAIAQVEKAKQEDAAAATASPPAIGVAPADSSGPLYAASVPGPVPAFAPAPAPVHTPAAVPASVPAPQTIYNVAGK